MRLEQRRFFPTELGETVEKVMVSRFPEIFNVEFTSAMENELDRVEDGELEWRKVLEEFYGPFMKALDAVDINALVMETHGLQDLAKEKCPDCGSPLEVRSGRFGPFIACARYPDDCKHTRPIKKDKVPDKPTDEVCHLFENFFEILGMRDFIRLGTTGGDEHEDAPGRADHAWRDRVAHRKGSGIRHH